MCFKFGMYYLWVRCFAEMLDLLGCDLVCEADGSRDGVSLGWLSMRRSVGSFLLRWMSRATARHVLKKNEKTARQMKIARKMHAY